MLLAMGFSDVIEAGDGLVGWTQLSQSTVPVGLILSDQNMPDCTGLEFLRQVRSSEQHKGIPFIMVTSETDRQVLLDAIKGGITAYLNKPILAEDLKKKIEYCSSKTK